MCGTVTLPAGGRPSSACTGKLSSRETVIGRVGYVVTDRDHQHGLPPARVPHVHMVSVHTSPLDQPGVGDAGGMNVYVLQLASELAAAGTPVTLWSTRLSARHPAYRCLAPGLDIHHLDLAGAASATKNDLRHLTDDFAAAMAARIDPEAPAILHAHYWISGLAAMAVPGGLPLVTSLHTAALVKNLRAAPDEPREPEFRVRAERRVLAASDAIIANTATEARQLARLYNAPRQRLHVIPPGVDPQVFRPDRDNVRSRTVPAAKGPAGEESAGVDPAPVRIVMAARLQPLKGPELLIDAAALLQSDPRHAGGFRVEIIGDGDPGYLARLRQQVAEADLGGVVEFVAPMPAVELAEVLRGADIVAVPSSSETFGLVALEAQACGTAVVASRVDGLEAAVADGCTGILVAQRTPQAWARALGALVQDPRRRRELGRNGARRAASLSWEAAARRTVELYRELMAGSASALSARARRG